MSTNFGVTKRRIIAALAAIMMVFSVFTVLPLIDDSNNVYAAGEKGVVNEGPLNVRSGAGTSYKILGKVNEGYTFTVTGEAKDKSGVKWYKFSYNSKNGYVSSKYVDIKQGSVISVSNLKGTVKATTLNVRTGAGNWYNKLGTLSKGKTFNITGKVTNKYGVLWYRLTYNGKTGYVHSNYITTAKIASYTVTTVSNTKGTVKSSSVNVRKGPGTSYSKLGALKSGDTFDITGKAKDKSGKYWYRFKYNGNTGFIHSNHVTTKSTLPYTVTEISDTKGIVKEGPLNVRKGPRTSYEKLGTIAQGKSFDITGKAKDKNGDFWYRFKFEGSNGFVHSDYVRTVKAAESVTVKTATVTSSDGLNARSGAGTNYSVLTVLKEGTVLTVTGTQKDNKGNLWYKYKYSSSKTGYVISDYVKIRTITSDSNFETYLEEQGFPDSFKNSLRLLHADHPEWVFKAIDLDYSWSSALSKQSVVGRNLVSSSAPKSHRSKAAGAYNSSTGVYTRFDGSWYSAHKDVIAHYMDPRNFLNESGIYQFMDHKYDSGSQSASTVKAVIKGSFMEGKDPAGDYSTYQGLIHAAGKNSGVNPNVLAAMIIQEQGWSGSALCSGTYSGYKGYYNFFNVGAYTTSTMSAVQRGLWYAKQQGWNSPYKSIIGGAKFYGSQYVNNNQDSYYTKKFNIKNGLSKVGTHQYMTFVAAAASEGSIVKRAYKSNSSYPIVFEIPVYNNMPSVACQLPN